MAHNVINGTNHNGDKGVGHTGDKGVKEDEERFKWFNKIVEIHKKYGLERFTVMGVRSRSKEDSLELVSYIYKDYILNSDRYPELRPFGEQLENFTVDDKPRAVGFIFGLIEACGEICMIDDVIDMAIEWSLEDKLDILLPTFFRLK